MDSGRKALLDKAREFGSLAQKISWEEVLNRSSTYRTLALYLGIQKEWWEEFRRSFFSLAPNGAGEKIERFRLSCKMRDLPSAMNFLSCWFGEGVRVSEIPTEEFHHAYSLVMGNEASGGG